MRPVGGLARLIGPAGLLVALLAAPAFQPQVRQWIVTVMDDDRQPVSGLGSEDFALKDGGARQPVIASEPASGPFALTVVVVGSEPGAAGPAGQAITALVAELGPSALAGQIHVLVDRTWSDVASLAAGAHLRPGDILDIGVEPEGTALGRAITDVATDGAGDRRVVVLIAARPVVAGPVETVLSAVEQHHTALWTVEVDGSSKARGAPPPLTPLDGALDASVAAGGGLRWHVAAGPTCRPGRGASVRSSPAGSMW